MPGGKKPLKDRLLTEKGTFTQACLEALVINAHGGKTDDTFDLDGHVLVTPGSLLEDYTYTTQDSKSAVEKHIRKGELKPVEHGQWTAYGLDDQTKVPDVKLQLLSGTIETFATGLAEHITWKGINQEIDEASGHYCDKDLEACLIIKKPDGTYFPYQGLEAKSILQKIIDGSYNGATEGQPVCFYAPKVNKCKILSDIKLSEILPEIKKIAGERMVVLATCNAGADPKKIFLDHNAPSIRLKEVLKKTNPHITALKESDLIEQSGQKGSNPGGIYKDQLDKKFYVKFPHKREWDGDPNGSATYGTQTFGTEMGNNAVKNEVLAAKFYQLGGIRVPTLSLVNTTDSGCLGIASEMVEFKQYQELSESDRKKMLDGEIPGLYEGFAFDAWLGCWDVYGAIGDNIGVVTHADGRQEVMRIDVGGALEYRACGLLKGGPDASGFTKDEVAEVERLKTNPNIPVFKDITYEHIKNGVEKIAKISDATIRKMISDNGGPGDQVAQDRLVEKLIQRKRFLMKKYDLSPDIVTFKKEFTSLDDAQLKEITGKIDDPPLKLIATPQFEQELTTNPGTLPDLVEPEFKQIPGKSQSAGVLIVEDDGRVWVYKPKNAYGGYNNTFPKGRLDDQQPQDAAIREAFEETGLKVEIVGYLGDFEKSTTNNRYYIARRTGGAPFGWKGTDLQPLGQNKDGSKEKEETEAVLLVNPDKLKELEQSNEGLAVGKDEPIISRFLEMQEKAMDLGEGSFFKGLELIQQEEQKEKQAAIVTAQEALGGGPPAPEVHPTTIDESLGDLLTKLAGTNDQKTEHSVVLAELSKIVDVLKPAEINKATVQKILELNDKLNNIAAWDVGITQKGLTTEQLQKLVTPDTKGIIVQNKLATEALLESATIEELFATGQKLYDAQQYEQAIPLLTQAANLGHMFAQYNLGNWYSSDQIGTKDYSKAEYWFLMAANQGDADAQNRLGAYYVEGRPGITKNPDEAIKWFNQAAEQGDASAQYNLAAIEQKKNNLGKAFTLYNQAAENGHVAAKYYLGLFYEKGWGTIPDYTKARKLYDEASSGGHKFDLQDRLKKLAVAESKTVKIPEEINKSFDGKPAFPNPLQYNRINEYYAPFEVAGQGVSSKTQAKKMLGDIKALLEQNPDLKIAITYSANDNESAGIYKSYQDQNSSYDELKKSGWNNISGGGQAPTFEILQKAILEDPNLRERVDILPVTTVMHTGGDVTKHSELVKRDMKNIAAHIDDGYMVLGLTNQNTANLPNKFAIGGKNAASYWRKPPNGPGLVVDAIMEDLRQGKVVDVDTAFSKGPKAAEKEPGKPEVPKVSKVPKVQPKKPQLSAPALYDSSNQSHAVLDGLAGAYDQLNWEQHFTTQLGEQIKYESKAVPVDQKSSYTIGVIKDTETEKALATIEKRNNTTICEFQAIESKDAKEKARLISKQQAVGIAFLENLEKAVLESDKVITVEANGFPPKDLQAILELIKAQKILNRGSVDIKLPENLDDCKYIAGFEKDGKTPIEKKYTQEEYDELKKTIADTMNPPSTLTAKNPKTH